MNEKLTPKRERMKTRREKPLVCVCVRAQYKRLIGRPAKKRHFSRDIHSAIPTIDNNDVISFDFPFRSVGTFDLILFFGVPANKHFGYVSLL